MPKKVLIVEDDYATQLLLRTMLESDDHQWRLAESYAEAEFDMAWADVAIVDQHLGDRTGVEVIEQLRICNPTCRIVMVTGDDTALDAAFVAGADDFLTKPFEVQPFLACLEGPSDRTFPVPGGTLDLTESASVVAEAPWFATN